MDKYKPPTSSFSFAKFDTYFAMFLTLVGLSVFVVGIWFFILYMNHIRDSTVATLLNLFQMSLTPLLGLLVAVSGRILEHLKK